MTKPSKKPVPVSPLLPPSSFEEVIKSGRGEEKFIIEREKVGISFGETGTATPPLEERTMNQPCYIRDACTGYMPGLAIPHFASMRKEVRWKVRHLNLSALDRATRQAAAADPAIVWDEGTRQYRFRRRSDPPRVIMARQSVDPAQASAATTAPSLATGGNAEGQGGIESYRAPVSQTGAGS